MEYETTGRLENMLRQINSESGAQQFVNEHTGGNGRKTFSSYMNEMIAQKNLELKEVIAASGISRNYVYQILNGRRSNPGRDKILATCIAAKLSFSETNRALKIAGAGILYAKDERDIWIAVALNREIGDVLKVNLMLEEKGVASLDI